MIENFALNIKLFYQINSLSGQNEILDNIFIFITDPLFYLMIIFFIIYFFTLI